MMFCHAAWTRLTTTAVVLCSLFTTSVYAHEDRLYTDSITYCAPPSALLIQNFEIQYLRKNQSVSFNIAAASVKENLNVTANIMLNIYGMNSLNLTFDFCSIAPGVICPLPTFNFNGSADIPLDFYSGLGLIDIQSRIPSIAYIVPDIEAFAQLTLRNVENGELVACVQATLSNGWSMRQGRATTTTIVIVVFAFFAALFQQRLQASHSPMQTTRTPSYSTQRLLDLVHFLQHIVVTGLFNVNYPLAYRSFVINFGWVFGLIRIGSVERAINRMRHATGSPNAANETALDPIAWTNRKSSPYNYNYTLAAVDPRPVVALAAPAVVTAAENDALPAGIPTIANSLGIPTQNAFMTLFFTLLFALCLAIAFFGVVYAALWVTRKVMKDRTPVWVDLMLEDYVQLVKAHGVLLAFLALLPTMILAFFQWSIKDSWLAVFFAVITFLVVLGSIGYTLFRIFRASRQTQTLELQSSPALVDALPLFGAYRAQRWSFSDLTVLSFFVKAIVIVAGRKHGYFQVVFIAVIEFLHFVAILTARPYKSRGGDAFATFLAFIRLLTTALVVAFVPRLEVKAIPRAALGMGSAVVSSVTVVVIFFSIVINALWGTFRLPSWLQWCRRTPKTTVRSASNDGVKRSADEKGPMSPTSDLASVPSASSSTARGSTNVEEEEPKKDEPQESPDDDAASWRPWSPTASARAVLSDLPPRPGPPEPVSGFATPARQLGPGEYDVELANQLSPIGALPSGLDLDSPMPYTPSGSFIGSRASRASISSYGCPVAPEHGGSWSYAGALGPASAGTWVAQTPTTASVAPTTATHGSHPTSSAGVPKLESVNEHSPSSREDKDAQWIEYPRQTHS